MVLLSLLLVVYVLQEYATLPPPIVKRVLSYIKNHHSIVYLGTAPSFEDDEYTIHLCIPHGMMCIEQGALLADLRTQIGEQDVILFVDKMLYHLQPLARSVIRLMGIPRILHMIPFRTVYVGGNSDTWLCYPGDLWRLLGTMIHSKPFTPERSRTGSRCVNSMDMHCGCSTCTMGPICFLRRGMACLSAHGWRPTNVPSYCPVGYERCLRSWCGPGSIRQMPFPTRWHS
jgi:hypothetical protein